MANWRSAHKWIPFRVPLSVQIFDQMRHHAAPGSCSQIASARDSLNFLWHPYGGSKRIWPVRCLGNCFPAIDLPSSKGRLSYTKYERKYLWDTMREIGLIPAPWLTFDNLLYFTDRKVLLKAGCSVTLWEFIDTFLINIFWALYLKNSDAVLFE